MKLAQKFEKWFGNNRITQIALPEFPAESNPASTSGKGFPETPEPDSNKDDKSKMQGHKSGHGFQAPPPPPPLPPHGPPPGHHPDDDNHHHRHPGNHHHHHESGFMFTLAEMINEGKLCTIDEMIAFATNRGESEIYRILQSIAAADKEQPLDLILKEVRLITAKDAVRASKNRKKELSNSKIGMFLPLPPHVFDEFFEFPNLKFLNPGGHRLPPHLKKFSYLQISSSHECRDHAKKLDVIVFEGFRQDGAFFIPEAMADVIDFVRELETIRFFIHHCPHKHHGTVSIIIKKYEKI